MLPCKTNFEVFKMGKRMGLLNTFPVPVRRLLLDRRTPDLRLAPPDLGGQGHLLARPQARLRPRQRLTPQPGGHAARLFAGR